MSSYYNKGDAPSWEALDQDGLDDVIDTSEPSAVAEDPGNYQPGNYVFQTLRTINAEEMKRLVKLMQTAKEQYEAQDDDETVETTEPEILRKTFPPIEESHEMNIANVIQTCNFLFRDGGTQLRGNKRVFWITDNDMPPGMNNRQPARTSYGDLTTYGVTAETFFIDRPDHRFNPNIFWNDILDREAIDYNDDQPDPEGLSSLADLMKDLVIKTSPKRTHFHVPLKLGKDGEIVIGVSGCSMVSEQGKGASRYVKMRGQVVEEVQSKTEYTSAKSLNSGQWGSNPIKVLGFQAASQLRFQDNLKHPFFIYPNEEEYTGSTRTFAALLNSCLKYNRHALALCRLRSNHVPEFCVLIPQEEKTSSNGQEYPPGFHLIILPYKDSIRPPPKKVAEFLQSPPIATDEQINAMKAVIKRTRFKAAAYRPEIYPNPSLAYHYDQLQALAFEEDWDPEDPAKQALDKTMPLYGGMHSRAGEFMEEFNKEIENDERAVEKLAAPTKRGKAEKETTVNEWDLRNIPDMWKKGTLSQLSILARLRLRRRPFTGQNQKGGYHRRRIRTSFHK
uniref:ATP-dependent DNA helicase II subunit 1 n=1 Tax=Cryptococcus deneoformans (strain B-3501A) TaxID=283643 RepID=KU70_CRYD3|nr:RecName: Full=ATP-dependent DNA helicase II subunit 1; AltName: Full=ATP-dependent DNA helicase II subunit Ku70 [Cryptococcus neoformans var. neoformans JEC21]P0CO51.1 RecName: Full=ATP-dependent DNA helicase II subunit 1; AltName: Full=ATP-dependent DNA helicase II subunit Ku70 [Cryptococcus neoformans var. neoformans B-3501A]